MDDTCKKLQRTVETLVENNSCIICKNLFSSSNFPIKCPTKHVTCKQCVLQVNLTALTPDDISHQINPSSLWQCQLCKTHYKFRNFSTNQQCEKTLIISRAIIMLKIQLRKNNKEKKDLNKNNSQLFRENTNLKIKNKSLRRTLLHYKLKNRYLKLNKLKVIRKKTASK